MKKTVLSFCFFLFLFSQAWGSKVVYSDNPYVLAPLLGTTWEFKYSTPAMTKHRIITFATKIVTTDGSAVMTGGKAAAGELCALMYSESTSEYVIIFDGDPYVEIYSFNINKDKAQGEYGQASLETGISTEKYPCSGTKTGQAPYANYSQKDIDDTYSEGYLDGYKTGYADGISAAFTAPEASQPLSETIADNTTFEFKKVLPATWYFLWVECSDGTTHQKWYKAADFTGETCKVSLDGTQGGKWWIRTWNKHGYGPWSEGREF